MSYSDSKIRTVVKTIVFKNGGTSNYTPCLKNITVQDFFDDYPEHLLII